jgi:hypothetical protein
MDTAVKRNSATVKTYPAVLMRNRSEYPADVEAVSLWAAQVDSRPNAASKSCIGDRNERDMERLWALRVNT